MARPHRARDPAAKAWPRGEVWASIAAFIDDISAPDIPMPALRAATACWGEMEAASCAPAAPAQPPLAQRPKRKPVLTLLALFLGFFGAHRFYMGSWGWGLVQLLGVPLVVGLFMALLPPLGGLLYVAAIGFVLVESVRYIWMSDAEFDAKVRAYQATQPGPFAFFW